MAHPSLTKRARAERRLILAKEARARKTGDWPEWKMHTFPKGSVSPNPKGWAYDFQTAYTNEIFSVLVRELKDGVKHLAVTSLSEIRPTWPEMQRIKSEIAGEEATAVEVYPPESEVVDDANMYHIWVITGPLSFSLGR